MKKLMLMGLVFIAGWIDGYAIPTVDIVAKVKPAVVLITTFDDTGRPLSLGTGFFIASHQIVTNSHVVRDGSYIRIQDLSGTDFRLVTIQANDPEQDLAILRTEEGGKTFLKFGDSKNLLEGQNILRKSRLAQTWRTTNQRQWIWCYRHTLLPTPVSSKRSNTHI